MTYLYIVKVMFHHSEPHPLTNFSGDRWYNHFVTPCSSSPSFTVYIPVSFSNCVKERSKGNSFTRLSLIHNTWPHCYVDGGRILKVSWIQRLVTRTLRLLISFHKVSQSSMSSDWEWRSVKSNWMEGLQTGREFTFSTINLVNSPWLEIS